MDDIDTAYLLYNESVIYFHVSKYRIFFYLLVIGNEQIPKLYCLIYLYCASAVYWKLIGMACGKFDRTQY